jgi:hypothetical protein
VYQISEAARLESQSITSCILISQALHAQGHYRESISWAAGVIGATSGARQSGFLGQSTLPSVQSRRWTLYCLGELGEFAAGASAGDEALEIAASVSPNPKIDGGRSIDRVESKGPLVRS